MIDELDRLVDEVFSLSSKLILLIGSPGSGKSALLNQLSKRRDARVLKVGADLGRELLAIPSTRRHLQAADCFKGLADEFAEDGVLLIDNIELLFDKTLHLSPLDLLRRHAQARRVIAVWPGDLGESRLSYATTGHPEYQNYGIDGVVPFRIN